MPCVQAHGISTKTKSPSATALHLFERHCSLYRGLSRYDRDLLLDLWSALFFNKYRLDGCAVQIPLSPQGHEAKRYREIDTFCFLYPVASLLADRGVKNKGSGLPLFAQWACKDPCGEQKGKALSGATIGSVVANPSLSALPSIQYNYLHIHPP